MKDVNLGYGRFHNPLLLRHDMHAQNTFKLFMTNRLLSFTSLVAIDQGFEHLLKEKAKRYNISFVLMTKVFFSFDYNQCQSELKFTFVFVYASVVKSL